jgi:predicted DCC family thiol-disulfide oxidoreductase YuxK
MNANAVKLRVLTDGACPCCRAVRARVEPLDTAHRLVFVDYNDPAVAASAPFSRDRLAEEMHLQAADGTWHVGFAAWVVILRLLPRWKWLGWLLGAFPVRLIGSPAYRWIARHRYQVPGFPKPCDAASCSIPAGNSAGMSSTLKAHPK